LELESENKPVIKKRVRVLRAINGTMLWLNNFSVAFLILSYLSPFISPESFWQIAFLGLAYPVLVLINLLFVFYWLILWKKRFLISLSAIAIGYFQLGNFIQSNFSGSGKGDLSKSATLVVSYNVRLFDLYNWTKNKQTRNKIFDLLKEKNADILCLQEIYTDDTKEFATIDSLLKIQKAGNLHMEYTARVEPNHNFGIATLTSYPIIRKGKLEFPEKNHNVCIYTDVLIEKDTVRIYNMHLQSIKFQPEEYKYVDDILNNRETEEEVKKSKNILRRLKIAFQKRAAQADVVHQHIEQCPYPAIVCGDFNDTPSSYTYHTISGSLKDAFKESGFGTGRTYIGKFPSFRIDYILYSNNIASWGFGIEPEELSDHYPISCYIQLAK
jgi:endonuclease/exonuclease/phosphatase family metal-dependent hydrolase